MFPIMQPGPGQPMTLSPMSLSDHLITLAKEAETAGYPVAADRLVRLALTIFDETPRRAH